MAGVKIDFMDRDDQWMGQLVRPRAGRGGAPSADGGFPRRLPRRAGSAAPAPNFMTQEGVMGAEYNKWSRRGDGGQQRDCWPIRVG
ncbi:MAG: hypothetical protein WDN24_02080 [Sphingomonas sp.]